MLSTRTLALLLGYRDQAMEAWLDLPVDCLWLECDCSLCVLGIAFSTPRGYNIPSQNAGGDYLFTCLRACSGPVVRIAALFAFLCSGLLHSGANSLQEENIYQNLIAERGLLKQHPALPRNLHFFFAWRYADRYLARVR